MEANELVMVDPAEDIRIAITRMVGSRLVAQKALKQLKSDMKIKPIEYDLPVEALEDVIEKIYAIEEELGKVHQSIIVSLVTETIHL